MESRAPTLQDGNVLLRTSILCPIQTGPTRKVTGRGGMSFEEENWIDEDATSHRCPDE